MVKEPVRSHAAPIPAKQPAIRGTNQSGMRARNERLVLTLIRRHGALAKADIARLTNLSAQTVSVIMRALEDDGLLLRGSPQRGRVGQPLMPMTLNPTGAFFLGLKIGRRSLEIVLTDFLGAVRDRLMQVHLYPAYDGVLDFTFGAVESLSATLTAAERDRIAGLGIAIPFQIWDWAKTIGVDREAMADWRNRDIQADLAARLPFAVFLQNDATAACSAELVFGTSRQPGSFLHFYVAFFIGGGVVLDGSLFPGASGNAGALGSMPVPDGSGGMCQLIDRASLATLEACLRDAGADPSVLWRDTEHWGLPEAAMQAWIKQAGGAIAHAVNGAMAVIDFPTVMIDGWLPSKVRDLLVAQVAADLEGQDFTGLDRPKVIAGTIGKGARAMGAASQPLLDRFLIGYTR